jgi:UDP-N-acetylglucosamine--N-acetylmuramyl-(pentapeptide) pyrophosphoryl-undecaprenol N-acetylglucosamine transferase
MAHGNPIAPPDASLDRATCRAGFGLSGDAVVVLIVGGSQGARAINEAVMGAVERVVRGDLERTQPIELLWATGPTNHETITNRLVPLRAEWVHAVAYIDDMPRALAATDLAVSRSGAMMTGELQSWGIPSILVPLPTSAEDHQTTNAEALAGAGAAEWTSEEHLTPDSLWHLIASLAADDVRRDSMSRAARARIDVGAARAIARDLITLLPAVT